MTQPEIGCPDCGRGSETLASLFAAGEALFAELAHHGLSPHDEDECVAGAAMDWWRRATEGLRDA